MFAPEMRFTPVINYYNTLKLNIIRSQSKLILGQMNSICEIVRFNILGWVTTSWTYSMHS